MSAPLSRRVRGADHRRRMDLDNVSLTSLFSSSTPPPEDSFEYGPLTISIPSKQGKAITLLADQVFNPAFAIVEQIDLGIIQVEGKSSVIPILLF
jgi:hypothetical protein